MPDVILKMKETAYENNPNSHYIMSLNSILINNLCDITHQGFLPFLLHLNITLTTNVVSVIKAYWAERFTTSAREINAKSA